MNSPASGVCACLICRNQILQFRFFVFSCTAKICERTPSFRDVLEGHNVMEKMENVWSQFFCRQCVRFYPILCFTRPNFQMYLQKNPILICQNYKMHLASMYKVLSGPLLFLVTYKIVCVQNTICICQNFNYLVFCFTLLGSKIPVQIWKYVFPTIYVIVQISNFTFHKMCICQNCKMYLQSMCIMLYRVCCFSLLHTKLKILKCICPKYKIYLYKI